MKFDIKDYLSRAFRHALSGYAGYLIAYAPSISAQVGAYAAAAAAVALSKLSDYFKEK